PAGPAGGTSLVPLDPGDAPGVIRLLRRGPVPAVDEVGRRDRVSVGEPSVGPDMKGVGQAVGRDGRLGGREVGQLAQLLVELVQAGEHVAEDVDVRGARDQGGVEVGKVLRDREAERLVGRQLLSDWCPAAGQAHREDEEQADQPNRNPRARRTVMAKSRRGAGLWLSWLGWL